MADFAVTTIGPVVDLDSWIAALIAKAVLYGWTDDTGSKMHSAADGLTRVCYCRFSKVDNAGTDYLKVEISNEATFTDHLITKYAFINEGHFPMVTPDFLYVSKYWLYTYNGDNDASATYPLAFGLFDSLATAAQKPAPLFLAASRDAAGGANTAVTFNDPTGRWYLETSAGLAQEGGVIGFNLDGDWGENKENIPYQSMLMPVPILSGNVADGKEWGNGVMHYMRFRPLPALTEGQIITDLDTGYSYYTLKNNSTGHDNFLVRVS